MNSRVAQFIHQQLQESVARQRPIKYPLQESVSGAAWIISELAGQLQTKQPLLLVIHNTIELYSILRALQFFLQDSNIPVFHLPSWETLPYDHFSPPADITSQRLTALYHLQQGTPGIYLADMATLQTRLPPLAFLHQYTFLLKVHDKIDREQLKMQLIQSGYRVTPQVYEHGEIAMRGSLLDIFPMGSTHPLRIDWDDEEIDSIRSFDPETQRTQEKIQQLQLLPGHEFVLNSETITHFRKTWREQFGGNPADSPLYQQVSAGQPSAGLEYYLPLLHPTLNHIFDYLPAQTILVLDSRIQQSALNFWKEVQERHEQLQHDRIRPLCTPQQLFIPLDHWLQQSKAWNRIMWDASSNPTHAQQVFQTDHDANLQVSSESPDAKSALLHTTKRLPVLHRTDHATHPLLALQALLLEHPQDRVLFCTESFGRHEALRELLRSIHTTATPVNNWQTFQTTHLQHAICTGDLEQGLHLPELATWVITENDLLGEQVQQRNQRRQSRINPDAIIRDLTELQIGAPIVHVEHGVGRYQGLETIVTNAIPADYLKIAYAGDDKVYIPVADLHLINRYIGDSEKAPLHRLGNKQWEKLKEETAKKLRDIAVELLEIQSRRETTPGFSFAKPNDDYRAFCAAFAFEETPDQQKAIQDVIEDMTSTRRMDRVVCGDVGFGKTEVAMRAAFLATQSNKQVAILVPTTLLATQHVQSFKDRFAQWPIHIAVLSRFEKEKSQDQTLKGLVQGNIDIVIGTHKLLQSRIQFKDLGLVIIDEEQRFGVQQKEKLKSWRAEVDLLTLTATPIPRTLNMSLAGLRDLSIIATPPARRLAIKTFVKVFDPTMIREALLREILRGGQVYFLHNDVATIQRVADQLVTLVPEAKIGIAHGQMPKKDLERIMANFYHQRFNILVCTTIIESGIDIPTANTMIIDRADCFGLAQLHQIRGRVGRSHHQGYTYLLISDPKNISADAKRRLEAIERLENLGAGFNLASYDLEIRGAGALLGEAQSGHIEAMGFGLYMDMLNETIKSLRTGQEPQLNPITPLEIDCPFSTIIPEDYVNDVALRLSMYKKLAHCFTAEAVHEFQIELCDRFGPLPAATQQLLAVTHLKRLARQIGIQRIVLGKEFGYIHFGPKPKLNMPALIGLLQQASHSYQLQGAETLRFKLPNGGSMQQAAAETSTAPEKMLQKLQAVMEKIAG